MARVQAPQAKQLRRNRWRSYGSSWLDSHVQAMRLNLLKFKRAPISSFLTSLVIAIALALPTVLLILVGNAQKISSRWDLTNSLTLYLHIEQSDAQSVALLRELNQHAAIASTQLISRDQALATFRELSGFADVLDTLGSNPLPAAIVIQPKAGYASAKKLQALSEQLQSHPAVDSVQLDQQWIERLNAMLMLVFRCTLSAAFLLAIAVLLVIGNTIRLEIYSRREEIVVVKLMGATNAFVRRPFLYGGFIYGLLGGLLGVLLVTLVLVFLSAPSALLADLYDSTLDIAALDPLILLKQMGVSVLLGLIGARLSVGRHLREIEP